MKPGTPIETSGRTPTAGLQARRTIRWGIIGCGDVTEVKSGPAFQRAANSELHAVMRRTAALAGDYARRHGVPRWYDDSAALIGDDNVDAVYIATPPGAHLECALMVASAGKPAYVEKPMARNAAECQKMIEAFDAAGVPLYVAFYRRKLPRFVLAKELVESGAVGQVALVTYQQAAPFHRSTAGWRVDAKTAGGGHFVDLGSHCLDLLDFIFGPLQDVAGVAANRASDYEVEDTVTMSFRTEGGIPGAATWDFAASTEEDLLRISGVDGQIELPVFASGPVRLINQEGAREFSCEHPPHVQQPIIQSVVDELLGRGSCPSTGRTAWRTALVMDQVLNGYYGGRNDAFWERMATWPGRRANMQS